MLATVAAGWFALGIGYGARAQLGDRRPIDPGEINIGLRLAGNGFTASPDGRFVAFRTTRCEGYIDLSVGEAIELPEKQFSAFFGENFPEYYESWSPTDQDMMAMPVFWQGKVELITWKIGTPFDPEHVRVLLTDPRSLGLSFAAPEWSPDGKTVYVMVHQELARNRAQPKNDSPPTESNNVTISLAGSYAALDDIHMGDIFYHPIQPLYPGAYAENSRTVVLAIDVQSGKVGMLARGNDIDRLYLSPDGKRLAAVQIKGRKTPVAGKGVLAEEQAIREGYLQYYGDVYVIDVAPVADLPAIDLDNMEDRTAGWMDRNGKRMTPVIANMPTNRTASFSPIPSGSKGTDCTPAVLWARDSSGFAYATVGRTATGDVYFFDFATGKTRNLTAEVAPLPVSPKQQGYYENQSASWGSPKFGGVFSPLWLPDGKDLVIAARGDVWRIPTQAGGKPENLTKAFDREVKYIVRTANQRDAAVDAAGRLVVISRDRMSRYDTVWKLDPATGALSRVADTGMTTDQRYFPDGDCTHLLFSGQSVTSIPNIFRLDLTKTADEGNKPDHVTRFRLDLAGRTFPESRVLAWKTPEGLPAYGLLYLPSGAAPDRKVPMVLMNASSSTFPSQTDIRAFAGASYYNSELAAMLKDGLACLYADIPMPPEGEYRAPMKLMAEGAIAAAHAAEATGLVDKDRMAIVGFGTFGGYIVYAALVDDANPFKTGVSVGGLADLMGFYLGASSFVVDNVYRASFSRTMGPIDSLESRDMRIGAPLWEKPGRYLENSPLARWDRIKAPVLVIQGGLGGPASSFFGEEAFDGLKYLDKNAVFAYYPRAVSWLAGDPLGLHRVQGWLDEQLLGKPPITQLADQGNYFIGSTAKPVIPNPPPPPEPSHP
jgi:dipeptidyl aminopeptidase/acylaminoacyl peptidase